jgi:hypothetical protein
MTENLVLFCSFLRVTGITYKLGKGVGKGQKQTTIYACSLLVQSLEIQFGYA